MFGTAGLLRKSPFSHVDGRVGFGRGWLRVAAGGAVVASVAIVVGGGIVRVTGSGLGCPDWPTCAGGALAPTGAMGVHAVVEFVNRMLTDVVCVVVGVLIVVARLQREPQPRVVRWAWVQFWVIVLNAVVGGMTVLARLNPYLVAAHFLAAALLLAAATVTWDLVQRGGSAGSGPGSASRPGERRLAGMLLAGTTGVMVVGTVVSGTGPHAGDSGAVPRMAFDWTVVTWIHGVFAGAVAVVAVMILRVSSAGSPLRLRITWMLVILGVQAVIGIVQSVSGLPNVVVVVHMLGAALVFIGSIRVFLETLPRNR
ncbi:heme A synthase [Nocardia sp. NPDC088792]|uniref:COX15/CtaA family protein n=1 Tax=Nocardia sp. NPDC088792 TaxID=3364332 RepID=UPI00380E2E44